MTPEILVLKPIYAPTLAALERDYIVHKPWTAPDPAAYMRNAGANVRALVTTSATGFTRTHLEALPKLEIVACFGTARGFDIEGANARGVLVTYTPDVIAPVVADLAIALLLAATRRICEGDRFVREGKWLANPPPVGRDIGGRTCGIVGLGEIGLNVARRAEAFGMSICYYGPRKKDVPYPYFSDLAAMASAADCLVVSCPETPDTRGLVDARVLEALGPRGYLVNVARGAVVDEKAFIEALQAKRIAGAGVDVYWDEPRVPQALLDMENVVLAPHVGSATEEIREARHEKLLANLKAYFAGEPVPYPLED
jgi:lactate dehydrogenase-like 2-hydroxyacid dehydrogenase